MIPKKYPKINTIWKRDPNNKYVILPGEYSKEEFKSINRWHVSEKIDGTNIRIFYSHEEGKVLFGGRTDKAQIPTHLLTYLQETFTLEVLSGVLDTNAILFGEGYGAKIQKGGGLYSATPKFALFDVCISNWWLKQEDVSSIAEKLGITRAPDLGIMSTQDAINFVACSGEVASQIAEQPKMAEGIICRSEPLMFYRRGGPIMWKLKCSDYTKLRNM